MEKSMTELRELAKSMDIKSYYKFRKDELVNEILKRIQEAKIAQGIIPPPPKEEKLEEEKKALANDLKEVYAEAKTLGFDTKALRGAIKFRKQDRQEREEQEAILELYLAALGDI